MSDEAYGRGEPWMTDVEAIQQQYAEPDRLRARMGVWRDGPQGISPLDVARDAVVRLAPARVIEIGCGTGELAAQITARLPHCDYLATDRSPGMVAASAARGLRTAIVDAGAMPFEDASADVVVAAWMLDLDLALREVRRVLRPGWVLVAVTNGDRHLADLLREAGGAPLLTQFSSENGEQTLGRHFTTVVREDIETRAYFEDHSVAVACLASFDPDLAASLARFDGAREYAGHTTVFQAW
jgi:SAM-dependent methyltransferase